MEKDGFKNIQKLLKISEQERHHEILLTMKNLRELSHHPSPYILPVIPRPLPTEIVEGEHYVVANLLTLVSGSSSPAQTSEIGVVGRELAISLWSKQPPLAREDPDPTFQTSKEVDRGSRLKRFPFMKKDSRLAPQAFKKRRRAPERQRAPSVGVEDFVP